MQAQPVVLRQFAEYLVFWLATGLRACEPDTRAFVAQRQALDEDACVCFDRQLAALASACAPSTQCRRLVSH